MNSVFTKRWRNAVLMLGRRRGRLTNIKTKLGQRLMLALEARV